MNRGEEEKQDELKVFTKYLILFFCHECWSENFVINGVILNCCELNGLLLYSLWRSKLWPQTCLILRLSFVNSWISIIYCSSRVALRLGTASSAAVCCRKNIQRTSANHDNEFVVCSSDAWRRTGSSCISKCWCFGQMIITVCHCCLQMLEMKKCLIVFHALLCDRNLEREAIIQTTHLQKDNSISRLRQ